MANAWKFEQMAGQALSGLAEMSQGQQPSPLHYVKNVLNGGELAPELWARFDQQRYGTGFHELTNMLPLATGGIMRRPGLLFLGHSGTDDETGVRLVPFVFSAREALVCEFYASAAGAGMRTWDGAGNCVQCLDDLPLTPRIVREMTYCQSADVLFLAHRDMPPCKIGRYAADDWRFSVIDWMPPIDPPAWAWCGAIGPWPENENRRVSMQYVLTAIDRETGAESGISDPWTLWNEFPLTESRFVEVKPAYMPNASEIRVYKKSAGVYGFIGRIPIPDDFNPATDQLVLEDKNIAPDTEDTPPDLRDPFNGEGNWPGLVFLHQQRLGYACSRSRPLTFWLSQSGNFESMSASIPPDDDDAIEATLAAPQANRILWALSDRNGLAFGTGGGEWLLAPGEGAALTPGDLSFQPQTSYGSEPDLPAVKAASSILFAQRGGRVIRDLGYSFQDDRYNAQDLTILARHITRDATIVSMAWQQEPNAVLWLVLSDGNLAGLTWLREHEVMAWHRHSTQGRVLQACAIPGDDGDTLVFFAIVRETAQGRKICIERFRSNADPVQTDGPDAFPYVSRAVPATPEARDEVGATFSGVRKIAAAKFATLNSEPFSCRVISQEAGPSMTMTVPVRPRQPGGFQLWNVPLTAGFRENPRLEICTTRPLTLLAITYAIEYSDMLGNQK